MRSYPDATGARVLGAIPPSELKGLKVVSPDKPGDCTFDDEPIEHAWLNRSHEPSDGLAMFGYNDFCPARHGIET